MKYTTAVPISEKYTLTIKEASRYFGIGENKLRRLANENLSSNWIILNGNRILIKRKQFEKILDSQDQILHILNGIENILYQHIVDKEPEI